MLQFFCKMTVGETKHQTDKNTEWDDMCDGICVVLAGVGAVVLSLLYVYHFMLCFSTDPNKFIISTCILLATIVYFSFCFGMWKRIKRGTIPPHQREEDLKKQKMKREIEMKMNIKIQKKNAEKAKELEQQRKKQEEEHAEEMEPFNYRVENGILYLQGPNDFITIPVSSIKSCSRVASDSSDCAYTSISFTCETGKVKTSWICDPNDEALRKCYAFIQPFLQAEIVKVHGKTEFLCHVK